MKQTVIGKAFEYACVKAIYNFYSANQNVVIVQNQPFFTAKRDFSSVGNKQGDLISGAEAAVRILDRLEPCLAYPGGFTPLFLSLQTDARGQLGDVRDLLCIRQGSNWEIGLSCKHNHSAVKHSRLSNTIDFGMKWFDIPCSQTYFDEIHPIFQELDDLREFGKRRNRPVLFEELDNVDERFYIPVLNAFIKELKYIDKHNQGVPAKLVHYLMGEYDFYKIITDDAHRLTKVEAVNINGTLNRMSEGHRSITTIPIMKLPTEIITVRIQRNSTNTLEVICDNAWTITMRIHTAKKEVEPSLKFDVNLSGRPQNFFVDMELWDK